MLGTAQNGIEKMRQTKPHCPSLQPKSATNIGTALFGDLKVLRRVWR